MAQVEEPSLQNTIFVVRQTPKDSRPLPVFIANTFSKKGLYQKAVDSP
jgi:hypothetical protein